MSNFSDKVKELSADDLAEALAACNREVKKRLKEKITPSHMSMWQYNEWASDEIRKGEAAKAKLRETE